MNFENYKNVLILTKQLVYISRNERLANFCSIAIIFETFWRFYIVYCVRFPSAAATVVATIAVVHSYQYGHVSILWLFSSLSEFYLLLFSRHLHVYYMFKKLEKLKEMHPWVML